MGVLVAILLPVISTSLYWAIFRKAGFGGATMAVALAPLVLPVAGYLVGMLVFVGGLGPAAAVLLALLLMGVLLSPLIFLLVAPWPVAAPHDAEN